MVDFIYDYKKNPITLFDNSAHSIRKSRQIWIDLLNRCFDDVCKNKNKSYMDTTCDNSWLIYSNFIKDLKTLDNHEKIITQKWQIDKDFIGKNYYSKDTILIIPKEINNAIIRGSSSTNLPLGVYIKKSTGRYCATISTLGKTKHVGYFSTAEEACDAYIKVKRCHVEELFKSYNLITPYVESVLNDYFNRVKHVKSFTSR